VKIRLSAVFAAWLASAAVVHADPATGTTATIGATNSASAGPTASDGATNSGAAPPSTNSATASAPHKGGFATIDIPPPPAGKGEVVFFRRSAFQGSAVWFKVREDGQELGKLTSGVYFVAEEEPGPHTFTAATENKDTLKLEVDPGETYYVEGRVSMGVFVGEANLSPSDEASFQKQANHLRAGTPPANLANSGNVKKP